MDPLELAPIDSDCMRCGRVEAMRVPGLCAGCREDLGERFASEARAVETAPYEPSMHVTPNAVALKDD